MSVRSKFVTGWILALVFGVAGCGWFGGEEEEDMDGLLPTLSEVTNLPAEAEAEPKVERLGLHLNVGDRFPLLKTVEQRLYQSSPSGLITNSSTLELLLAITVEEVEAERMRFAVRYHNVRYTHNVAGESIAYDSRSPQLPIPPAARVYHGLVDNEFSFWIGPDNRITELVGFREFLTRCLAGVPEQEQQAMLAKLSNLQGAQGIANFVDDSIGLLPYDSDTPHHSFVRVGDTWSRSSHLTQPVPMKSTTNFTLKSLDDKIAQIDVLGTVEAAHGGGTPSDFRWTLRKGHCFGSCTIDRATGLPIRSRVERYLDMNVQVTGSESFEQRKEIVTTIRAFPEQGETETVAVPQQAAVVPVGGAVAPLANTRSVQTAAVGAAN